MKWMDVQWAGVLAAVALGLLGMWLKAMDAGGCIAGVGLSLLVVYSLGTRGFFLVMIFVVLGSVATRFGYNAKAGRGVAQRDRGRRSTIHAFAKLSVPALCALLAKWTSCSAVFSAAFVAALAAALADTLATEVGQVFGKQPALIVKRRVVAPGTPGAVSWQGLLAGMMGALLMGAVSIVLQLIQHHNLSILLPVVLAALIMESLLGEASQRVPLLTNPVRNLAITTVAALLMLCALLRLGNLNPTVGAACELGGSVFWISCLLLIDAYDPH